MKRMGSAACTISLCCEDISCHSSPLVPKDKIHQADKRIIRQENYNKVLWNTWLTWQLSLRNDAHIIITVLPKRQVALSAWIPLLPHILCAITWHQEGGWKWMKVEKLYRVESSEPSFACVKVNWRLRSLLFFASQKGASQYKHFSRRDPCLLHGQLSWSSNGSLQGCWSCEKSAIGPVCHGSTSTSQISQVLQGVIDWEHDKLPIW